MIVAIRSAVIGAMPSSISLASGNASLEALKAAGVLDAYNDILMKKRGVMLLGVPMSGVGYVFQVRGRPDSLAYFKDKKIRSIPLYDPILEALGAVPVTTSPAEAYTAAFGMVLAVQLAELAWFYWAGRPGVSRAAEDSASAAPDAPPSRRTP